jgi:hypothetical protein
MKFAESRIRVSLAGRVAMRLKWDTPLHEAAHIVTARTEQMRVYEASITPDADSDGRIYLKPAEERTSEARWVHRRSLCSSRGRIGNRPGVRRARYLRMLEQDVAQALCRPENRHLLHALAAELRERKTLERGSDRAHRHTCARRLLPRVGRREIGAKYEPYPRRARMTTRQRQRGRRPPANVSVAPRAGDRDSIVS